MFVFLQGRDASWQLVLSEQPSSFSSVKQTSHLAAGALGCCEPNTNAVTWEEGPSIEDAYIGLAYRQVWGCLFLINN